MRKNFDTDDNGRLVSGTPNKAFLQIGDYPRKPSSHLSFLSWEEYVALLGYRLIYKHEYVAGLMKSLTDLIATLKVIKIPCAGLCQYIGFLKLPDEFCLDLQPGDVMKVNFNVEEPESHTDWHMCVVIPLPIAPLKAAIILLTQPWDKEKRNGCTLMTTWNPW
ncbi:hypothetical protein Aspvir_006375 [Aspergillus viridinutans]|uniref:Uncharacterized protein n=1 Tax=Aspergillus viridinutans TaxID=75553 RepID=A0A9P3BYV8_ASPVI|nr:uncharacterized protein Aspvir_006375 [Aspergillus viridinutans]GIK02326.1 hypothetical protein Aspvir_006375 [Aspergillus viridinutans]